MSVSLLLKQNRIAFTLAEVLITLVVIGIVAALTIPAVLQSINNAEFETKLKREVSNLSQSINMLRADNGGDLSTVFGTGSNSMLNVLGNKLVFVKTCLPDQDPGVCWHDGNTTWHNLYGDYGWVEPNGVARAILNDSTMIAVWNRNLSCASNEGSGPLAYVCGIVYIDINGFKGPNVGGRDIFRLYITNSGIYPSGTYSDAYTNWTKYCNNTNSISQSGVACAAKILAGGTVD